MQEEFSSTFLSSLVNHQISGNQKHHRFRISHSSINTMAEWSQLPKDLLEEISGHLDTSIDLLRFRSICTSWRSSSLSHKRQYFPGTFRILPNDGIAHTSSLGFHLSTRTILLISSLCDPALDEAEEVGRCSSWLIKVEEHGCGVERKRRLLHPLARSRYPLSSSSKFPLRLDFSNYRVRELGQEYVLHHVNFKSNASSLMDNNNDAENLYMEKVVSIFLNGEGDFVLLTIHVSGKLAMFKSGEKRWAIIPDMPSPYDDVIVYKGKFFAVDNTGRTVVVGLDRELGVVANPVFGGDKKYLVKSRDGLLLVDMYLSIDTGEGALSFDEGFLEHLAHYMSERTVRFNVFKLDEEGKNWIGTESLGDRVLFLGDDSSFCVSSSDLSGCKGNQIIFGDNFSFMREPSSDGEDGVLTGHDMGVFELETGCIGPLGNYPGHSKLFWPPPQWVISTSSEVQDQTQTEAPSQ